MQQKKQNQNKIFDRLFDYILKNKLVFGGIVIGLVIVAFGVTTMNFIDSNNTEKASKVYDIATSYLGNLSYITNESERAKIYQEQIQNLNSLVQSFPKTVPATRARLLLAKIYYENGYQSGKQESINMAASYYSAAYDTAKSGFYKVLALLGRAECSEQKNDLTKAFADYYTIYTKFPKEGFSPIAIIGMARTQEMQNDGTGNSINQAVEYYKKLVKEFPDSKWVQYAKGKIYFYAVNKNNRPATTAPNAVPQLPLTIPQK